MAIITRNRTTVLLSTQTLSPVFCNFPECPVQKFRCAALGRRKYFNYFLGTRIGFAVETITTPPSPGH